MQRRPSEFNAWPYSDSSILARNSFHYSFRGCIRELCNIANKKYVLQQEIKATIGHFGVDAVLGKKNLNNSGVQHRKNYNALHLASCHTLDPL